MKKINYTIIVMAISLLSTHFIIAQTIDSLSMGPGYASDIYYSFENGEVATIDRSDWDIAFYTNKFSAGVISNDGADVEVYEYPGDTNSWSSIDTTGMSTWDRLYNSAEIWEDGSFNQNSTGHPNYGWGWYNMQDHHLYGVRIYILKMSDTLYKKLWIKEKRTIENIFVFTYANLDGSKEENVTLEIEPYEEKNFAYYSIKNNKALDREPANTDWDILFTKWIALVDNGEGGFSPYPVTGVLCNVNVGANNFYPVTLDYDDWSAKPFDSIKDKIGYDWKSFDFSTGWQIQDSNVYFVQDIAGAVHKLLFTYWGGAMSGEFALSKQMVSGVSVEEIISTVVDLQVYPNPATAQFTIKVSDEIDEGSMVSIYDQSGRIIYQKDATVNDLRYGLQVNNLDLAKGLYIVNIKGNGYSESQKLMIK